MVWHQLSIVSPYICQVVLWWIVVLCHVQVVSFRFEQIQDAQSDSPNSHFHFKKKKEDVEHEFNGEDSTQIFSTISVLSFSNVIEYPFIFKCEVYCRGILNFNCDAFNRTLCALITLLLICCVYWCPFCVIAIWLLVLFSFFFMDCFKIQTHSVVQKCKVIFKHNHKHSPYNTLYL